MKKMALCLPILILIFSSFKVPATKATEKVEAIFNETFKDVKNVQWYVTDNTYSARFTNNTVITSITYNKKGRFVRSRRCAGEELLPLNILEKIKEEYTGKTIKLITEIVEGNDLVYSLIIDDAIYSSIVAVRPLGKSELLLKFKRQQ